ncbi:MAG: hypothetical protein KGZ81_07140, partial [Flavobacteriales bacterium]|nr:hypothetical protein [Flavobacteriales bacterium]
NIAIGNLKTAVELQTGAQEGLASAVSIATSNWDANLKIVGSVGPAHQQQVAGVLELKSAVSEVVVTWKDAYSLIQTQSIQLNQRLQYTTNDIMGMYQKVTNQANDTAIKIQGANAQIQGGAANLQGGAVQKRATGGPVSSGRSYVVGEMEQEVFVPNSSGTVYNQQQMRNMGAGSSPNGGGGVTIQTLIIQPQTYEAGMGVFKALDNDSLLASKNLTTNGGGIR